MALLANFAVLQALVFLSLMAVNFSAGLNAGFALPSMVTGAPPVAKLAKTHPVNQNHASHVITAWRG